MHFVIRYVRRRKDFPPILLATNRVSSSTIEEEKDKNEVGDKFQLISFHGNDKTPYLDY